MIALFTAAFLAATLLPAQSELGLAYLVSQRPGETVQLIAVASLGNTLGSLVNWAIGRGLIGIFETSAENRKRSRWYDKAEVWYQRYGYWSLLASWMPVIGDPITLVAGVMKEPLWRFLVLVAIAKTARYIFVAVAALYLVGS